LRLAQGSEEEELIEEELTEDELSAEEELTTSGGGLSSDEQEKVNAKASETPAVSRKCFVFISNLLWLGNFPLLAQDLPL
jgi:hypothetical protein